MSNLVTMFVFPLILANATTPTQSRYRMVVQRAANGGQECPDTMFEERECEPLPVCPTYRSGFNTSAV